MSRPIAPAHTHAAPPPPAGPVPYARELSLALLADMLRVRRLEEKCAELYGAGKIRGFLHLYIGEEAVAAGAMRALAPEDNVIATYREHGHALLRGVRDGPHHGRDVRQARRLLARPRRLDASLRREDALLRRQRDRRRRLAACRRLWLVAVIMKKETRVTACFFGEGAVAEGAFHESMNLAQLWRLPVAFFCENNLYAMGTDIVRSESQTDLCVKAAAYGMATLRADGMDVVDVHEAAKKACAHVRAGNGPVFVELKTYRYRAHSMFDPDLYRDKAEIEQWKTRGPIHTFSARLKAQGDLTEAQFLEHRPRRGGGGATAAVAFAEAGTWEPVEDLTRDVYAP